MSFSLQGTITERLLQELCRSILDTAVITIGFIAIGLQSASRVAGCRNN